MIRLRRRMSEGTIVMKFGWIVPEVPHVYHLVNRFARWFRFVFTDWLRETSIHLSLFSYSMTRWRQRRRVSSMESVEQENTSSARRRASFFFFLVQQQQWKEKRHSTPLIRLERHDVDVEACRMGFSFDWTLRRSSKSSTKIDLFYVSRLDLVTDQMWRINQPNATESRAEQRMSDQSQSIQILVGDQWIHRYSQEYRQYGQ